MRSFLHIIISLFIFVFPFLFTQQTVFAAPCSASYQPTTITENQPFTITIQGTTHKHAYHAFIREHTDSGSGTIVYSSNPEPAANQDNQEFRYKVPGLGGGIYDITAQSFDTPAEVCLKIPIEIKGGATAETPACFAWIEGDKTGDLVVIKMGETRMLNALGTAIKSNTQYIINISGDSSSYNSGYSIDSSIPTLPQMHFRITTQKRDGNPLTEGSHVVTVSSSDNKLLCATSFAIGSPGAPPPESSPTPVPPALLPCAEGIDAKGTPIPEKEIKDNPARKADIAKCTKIDSAIGPIDTKPEAFIAKIFIVLLSMGGGWAVYLITVGGYQLMFSQGNPEKVQEARDKITSAIVGLIFMILSLLVLQVIGVDIFQLPTFKR